MVFKLNDYMDDMNILMKELKKTLKQIIRPQTPDERDILKRAVETHKASKSAVQ